MKNKILLNILIIFCSLNSILHGRVPVAGDTWSVADLRAFLKVVDPNADFLVPLGGQLVQGRLVNPQVMTHDNFNASGVVGSKGVTNAGLSGVVNANLSAQVTLSEDPALINHLESINKLNSTTQSAYQAILLYFTLKDPKSGTIYRFYLNDPFPASIIPGNALKPAGLNPAKLIINKWRAHHS